MLIGLSMPLPAYTIDPAFMARNAERLGFESIWYAEHPAVPVESASPFPATGGAIPWTYSHFTDPYIALARASAVTTKLKLGTGITLVPQRNPLLLAKEIAALDLHSGGRFIFGIGTGWLKEEVEMFGGNFQRRWTQTREALDVMKALWTQDAAEFHGEFFDFPPVRSYPKPAQKPHPPIVIGGSAKNVLKGRNRRKTYCGRCSTPAPIVSSCAPPTSRRKPRWARNWSEWPRRCFREDRSCPNGGGSRQCRAASGMRAPRRRGQQLDLLRHHQRSEL